MASLDMHVAKDAASSFAKEIVLNRREFTSITSALVTALLDAPAIMLNVLAM